MQNKPFLLSMRDSAKHSSMLTRVLYLEITMRHNKKNSMKPETQVIHAGLDGAQEYGAVSVPIYQSSTFSFRSADEGASRFSGSDAGYKYTRLGNPTVRALERAVCALEGGYRGLATATGMAAISTVFLTFLRSGDHVIGTDAVYGPTRLLLGRRRR